MRKRCNKIFVLLLMVTLSVLSFTGCHGSVERETFEIPQEFDTSRNYEITFWAKNDTNKNQTRIYEQAITDFQKLYPNVTINLRLYTDYGKIYTSVFWRE